MLVQNPRLEPDLKCVGDEDDLGLFRLNHVRHPTSTPAKPPSCGERDAPLSIPRPSATPGPLDSPREWVVGERRVVEDQRLGLAAQQADLQLLPELVGSASGPMILQPIEPVEGKVAMSQPLVGHRQERTVPRPARPAPKADVFLQAVHGLVASAGAVQCGPERVQVLGLRWIPATRPDGGVDHPERRLGVGGPVRCEYARPGDLLPPSPNWSSCRVRSSSAAFDLRQPARSPDNNRAQQSPRCRGPDHRESCELPRQASSPPRRAGHARRTTAPATAALHCSGGERGSPRRRRKRRGPTSPALSRRRPAPTGRRRRRSGPVGAPGLPAAVRRVVRAGSGARATPCGPARESSLCSSSSSPVMASTQATSRGTSSGSGAGAAHCRAALKSLVTRDRPSGLKNTRRPTRSVEEACRIGGPIGWPVAASHNRAVPSREPVRIVLPSGLNATEKTPPPKCAQRWADRLAGGGVPLPRRLVIAPGEDLLAVGTECHGVHISPVLQGGPE